MDDQERAALRATRDKALSERQRLDVVIGYLSEQLGEPVPPDGGGGGFVWPEGNPGGGGDPVAGTVEGQYLGMTSTKAAREVLATYGNKLNPLTTKQLYEAIKKGGVKISNEESLARMLHRSHTFRKAGRAKWGLSEWYGNTATTSRRRTAAADNVSSLPPNGATTGDEVSDDENTEVESA